VKRAALYLRVSRDDLSLDNQRPELEALARRRGLEVAQVFEERVSAAARERPAHAAMMKAAQAGKVDVVLVWAIDRFGRSLYGNLGDVLALDRAGVELVSVKEPWLDMGGPTRQLLLAVFSWVAEQERARLIERTKAGQARARAEGTRIGRPLRLTRDVVAEVGRLAAGGKSVRSIAKALKLPRASVHRAIKSGRQGTEEIPR